MIIIITIIIIIIGAFISLSKSTQSTAGLKALKPAASGCYLSCMCKYQYPTTYIHCT